MKRLLIVVVAFAILLLNYSCKNDVFASNQVNIVTSSMPTEATAIEINGGFELILSDDVDESNIIIEANENIHQYINTKYSSSDNLISFELSDKVKINDDLVLRLRVNGKNFNNLTANGGSLILIPNQVESTNYRITLSGGSLITAKLKCDKGYLSLSGGSRAYLEGSSVDLEVTDCSGGSFIDGYGFSCDNSTIKLSGGSEMRITVNNSITGECSGGSELLYKSSRGEIADITLSGGSKANLVE